MPSRKPHQKSRNGCDTCKKRRVKCDELGREEGRPCANCTIRRTACTYNAAPVLHRPETFTSANAISDNSSQASTPYDRATSSHGPSEPLAGRGHVDGFHAPTPAARPPERFGAQNTAERLAELKLMHFWCIKTSYSFSSTDSKTSDVWQHDVTRLAFAYDFLLDILFALTLTHIASEETDSAKRAAHVSAALLYQTRAFVPFRVALGNVNAENCHAVFSFVLMNAACSGVTGQLPTGDQDQASTPLESIMTFYDATMMLQELIERSAPWLKGGLFGELPEADTIKGNGESKFRRVWTEDEVEGIRRAMQRLRALSSRVAVEKHPIYSRAIAMLEEYYLGRSEYGIGWLALSGSAYCQDVRQEESLALMLLLHWAVLMSNLHTMWWAVYCGNSLLGQLCPRLHVYSSNPEWTNSILWCKQMVNRGNPG